jgi:hypothetical protein
LNAAVVELAGTVSVAGMVTVGEAAVLVSVTTAPPACAGRDNVAVHVLLWFGPRVEGLHTMPDIVGGIPSEILTDAVVPFRDPVRVAV